MTKYVTRIKCENYRLQATKFNFPNTELLILNTYFPCDPRTSNFNDAELLRLLSDTQAIIQQAISTNVWVAGDLNYDFSRNTTFSTLVHDYFEEIGLKFLWENYDQYNRISKPSYTYLSHANGTPVSSTIDHFAFNPRLLPLISEAGPMHSGENPSNHSAIYAKLDIGDVDTSEEIITVTKHVDWSGATEGAKIEYEARLTEQLLQVYVPGCVMCTDVHCMDHGVEIEQYTLDILETVQSVARDTLPVKGGGRKSGQRKCTPGWSEHVKPYQEESKFWHSLWMSAGRPNYGALYNSMKQARQQYKYAVRRLSRAGDSIKNDKFVNSVINS